MCCTCTTDTPHFLHSLVQVLGIYTEHGVEVTRDEVQRIFDAADKDGTGLLTEQEFVNSSKPGEVAGVRKTVEIALLFFE